MIYYFQTLSLKTRFLSVLLLLFPVLVFHWLLVSAPWALTQLVALSKGTGLPDAQFWYTPRFLNDMLSAWGDDGRTLYLTVLWPTDFGYLVSYAAFLAAATLYLLKKANPRGPWWYLLPLLPLGTAAFDLLENSFVALDSLVPLGDVVAWAAACCTAAKWVTTALSGAVLCIGATATLIRAALARYRTRHYTDTNAE